MKSFRDSNNCEWTVFEVRRQISTQGHWSHLPNGYHEGWLCFEAKSAKRRLVRFPERWRELGDAEMEKLLDAAQPAPRVTWRPADDLGDAPSPDAR